MRFGVLTLLGVFAMSSGFMASAQDYDDIYYNSTKSQPKVETKVSKQNVKRVVNSNQSLPQYRVNNDENYINGRDVDEYNRRGAKYEQEMRSLSDSDSIYNADSDVFANTEKIEKFHNPNIVIRSNDPDLIELYYDSTPTVNLVIGSTWGPSIGWGYAGWYDPWYSWYDPWYSWYTPWYSSWYGPRWYAGWSWGWGGLYDPWFGFGWHGPGWGGPGWGGHGWDYGWDYGHGGWGSGGRNIGGRRPMGYASNYASNRANVSNGIASSNRRPLSSVSGSNMGSAIANGNVNNVRMTGHRGISTANQNGFGGNMSAGRGNSNVYQGGNNRSATAIGNMGRRPSSIANSVSRNQVFNSNANDSRTSNNVYNNSRSTTSRIFESRSYNENNTQSRSYNTPSRSSSSSSWGGGRSSGGFSGGGFSGGGFSGGGGGGFSGGGGHRR